MLDRPPAQPERQARRRQQLRDRQRRHRQQRLARWAHAAARTATAVANISKVFMAGSLGLSANEGFVP
jgi:hypothetical protein